MNDIREKFNFAIFISDELTLMRTSTRDEFARFEYKYKRFK